MKGLKLRKAGGLPLFIPPHSVSSIVGLESDPDNPHRGQAKAIVRFRLIEDATTHAFVEDAPADIFAGVVDCRPDWVALTTAAGDPAYLPGHAITSLEGLDGTVNNSCSLIHFDAGDKRRFLYARETADYVADQVAKVTKSAEELALEARPKSDSTRSRRRRRRKN